MPIAKLARLVAATGVALWAGLASAQPVTVKMWMHEHPPRIAIDKAIIAEFEKANPDIKIQYDVISVADYSTKLITAFAAGSGPGHPVFQRPHPRPGGLRRHGPRR